MHDNLTGMPVRLTYDDYCALPDDGRRYEILDGDLYMSPAPIPLHQRIVLNLAAELRVHVRSHRLGEVFVSPIDVLLSENDIVQPDLVFVARERRDIVSATNIKGSPDLHVEVLSPSNTQRDVNDKRSIYARCAVNWYWILDPDKGTLTELQRVDRAYAEITRVKRGEDFSPKLFAGLTIDLDSLWD